MMSKTKILVTVDVECSIGGYFCDQNMHPVGAERHIFCRINGKDYGIGLIMDILDAYNIKGVFFVETEARHYFGEAEIKQVVDFIIKRGHDVQLHIHPEYLFLDKELLGKQTCSINNFSFKEQKEMIKKGKAFLEASGAKDVCAFRSGSYYSNIDTIRALRESGILYSSSYNLSFKGRYEVADKYYEYNTPFYLGDIIEFPITCIKQSSIMRNEYRSFQICALSSVELKKAIEFYIKNKLSFITIITHSFEFVKSKDIQYSRLRPYELVIKRFEDLCKYISEVKEKAEVVTFSDLRKKCDEKEIFSNNRNIMYKSYFIDKNMRYLQQLFCK